MSLYQQLQSAQTEEDVKAAYIKALGLKHYSMNLTDIQTEQIWFEAKEKPTPIPTMFAQLLFYIREAKKAGSPIPAFLSVIDREKAALMETANAEKVLKSSQIKWPTKASDMAGAKGKDAVSAIKPFIEAHFTTYYIEHDEKEFIHAIKQAINTGKIIRTPITPENLRTVFDKWMEMVGCEINGVAPADYAVLFYADIMFDPEVRKSAMGDLPVRLLMDGERPVFVFDGKSYDLGSARGHAQFWRIYHRPPAVSDRNDLLSRRDSLLPLDERSFKGAYFTPLSVVDKAYELLAETLGKGWQDRYIVWDPCCGVGNLETKHINPRNVFMSTLDKADIEVMRASKTCPAATKFQYDYLNDDINDDGEIDYRLTNKMPPALREAIADAKAKKKGAKKILILMNPPYAEVGTGADSGNKAGVANTKFSKTAMSNYGKANGELFTQFVARIKQEVPNATLAMFSKLKYINAPNFSIFRDVWKAQYLGGFVVHSKAFDGLNGNFPIGFLVWDTSKSVPINVVATKAINKQCEFVEIKFFHNLPTENYLNVWMKRPKRNAQDVIPLKNALSPATSNPRVDKWSDNAVGYMYCGKNDLQHASQQTVLFSSAYGQGDGFYLNSDNLWQAAIIFTVRRIIKPTWLNDRDQFLQPTGELTDEFKHDCLIWMLFNGSNLTASADGLEWNGKKWSIVNHFIPFTESEVGANGKFESDFMVQTLRGKKLSVEAKAVLMAGKALWHAYFQNEFERKIRDQLKLNRPDVGWYQVRNALKAATTNGDINVDFSPFENAYQTLSDKLRPMVYELGFLK